MIPILVLGAIGCKNKTDPDVQVIVTFTNDPDIQTIVNFTMADDLIFPPRINFTQYIAGNITISNPEASSGSTIDYVRIWGWSRTGKIAFSKEIIRPEEEKVIFVFSHKTDSYDDIPNDANYGSYGDGTYDVYVPSGETEIVNAYMLYIEYFIIDLIEDEIVFQCSWDSHGMGYSGEPPQQIFFDMSEEGIEKMFNLQKETILSANMNHDIIYNQVTLLRFPFTHNNLAYNCRADTVYKSEDMSTSQFGSNIVQTISSYDIVVSRGGISKIIYSGSLGTGSYSHWPNMHICGYFRSPYENRIAVIVALEYAGMGESLVFEFHGCHLDIGF
jgi:hypothetical protein